MLPQNYLRSLLQLAYIYVWALILLIFQTPQLLPAFAGTGEQSRIPRLMWTKEFGRLWAANENLLSSRGDLRNNIQAIKKLLKKTQKAQEDCATLQAARLEILTKGKKCNTILCSPCVWSNNTNSMKSSAQRNLTDITRNGWKRSAMQLKWVCFLLPSYWA